VKGPSAREVFGFSAQLTSSIKLPISDVTDMRRDVALESSAGLQQQRVGQPWRRFSGWPWSWCFLPSRPPFRQRTDHSSHKTGTAARRYWRKARAFVVNFRKLQFSVRHWAVRPPQRWFSDCLTYSRSAGRAVP